MYDEKTTLNHPRRSSSDVTPLKIWSAQEYQLMTVQLTCLKDLHMQQIKEVNQQLRGFTRL